MSAQTSTGTPPAQEKKPGGLGTAAPKRKPRNPVLDWTACLLVRGVIVFFRVLPRSLSLAAGRGLGLTMWALSRRYRRQVVRHMDIAFRGEFTKAQKRRWCRLNFMHIGQSLAEFARLPALNRENMKELVDLTGGEKLKAAIARGKEKGKGVICMMAHHGNWELGGYVLALAGYPLEAVVRPLDNPRLNVMINRMREACGNHLIEKWQVLWKLKKLLDKGKLVALSIDQNGGVGGLFTPVFGTWASTVTSPAQLHVVSGAPIVVATVNRQPDGVRHTLTVWEVIEHSRTEDLDADLEAILRRINAAYEKAIRAYPEQWLWAHKRWKTRPPGETPGPDGLPPRANVDGDEHS